ncbi:MAG: sugar phosphate isomerase/epimerase [Planctomycetes bacterium]|nr:sugar phosphate isomerase/epimerase [Planctomycetota bacterium]NOG56007.1 sugar phosphate isomerase/epimerase [Planctomycetota bacterium]
MTDDQALNLPSLPLSAALGVLLDDAPSGLSDPKVALRQVAACGLRWVQLPATRPGLRPRDLDRSARRDLLATLRRNGLSLSGLDLWIPVDHFTDSLYVDRAVAAVAGAIELAGDLGRVPVSLALPGDEDDDTGDAVALDADAVEQMRATGEAYGVRLAVYRADTSAPSGLSVGFDPAVCYWHGDDPLEALGRIESDRLAGVRLTDVDGQGLRVCPGSGRLDLCAFQGVLLTIGYSKPVVLDLKQVNGPWQCLQRALAQWKQSGLSGASFL